MAKKGRVRVVSGCLIPFLLSGLFVCIFIVPPSNMRNILIAVFVISPLMLAIEVFGPLLFPGLTHHEDDEQSTSSKCLQCGSEIREENTACPKCGWTWNK